MGVKNGEARCVARLNSLSEMSLPLAAMTNEFVIAAKGCPEAPTARNADTATFASRANISAFETFNVDGCGLFVSGGGPAEFLRQLAAFICGCFTTHTSHYTSPESVSEPSMTTVALPGSSVSTPWRPLLFRGAAALGDLTIVPCARMDGTVAGVPTGTAVDEVITLCDMPHCEPVVRLTRGLYDAAMRDDPECGAIARDSFDDPELLWPAALMIKTNPAEHEYDKFILNILRPAINIWFARRRVGPGRVTTRFESFVSFAVRSLMTFGRFHHSEEGVRTRLFEFLGTYMGDVLRDADILEKLKRLTS